jgi:hypothetical protein
MDLAAGQMLMIWAAEPGSKSAQALSLLGSWAATPQQQSYTTLQAICNRPRRAPLGDSLAGSPRDDEDSDSVSSPQKWRFAGLLRWPDRVRIRLRDERDRLEKAAVYCARTDNERC